MQRLYDCAEPVISPLGMHWLFQLYLYSMLQSPPSLPRVLQRRENYVNGYGWMMAGEIISLSDFPGFCWLELDGIADTTMSNILMTVLSIISRVPRANGYVLLFINQDK